MNIRALFYATVVAVSLGHMGTAIADDLDVMPEVKTQNGVSYLSGGIGSDQVLAMKAAAKDYTLMVTCAAKSGEYLADVKVSITDKSGAVVLDTVTDGPILLVRLSPGQYHLSAVSNGGTVNKTVGITANHTSKLDLYWPDQQGKEQ